mgnify:CR=1 FL=1
MADEFWNLDALLSEESASEELVPEVVVSPSMDTVRHNLLALLQTTINSVLTTSEARDVDVNDVKVISELMRSVKMAEEMLEDDELSKLDDATLRRLAEEALKLKQLGSGNDQDT